MKLPDINKTSANVRNNFLNIFSPFNLSLIIKAITLMSKNSIKVLRV